MMDATLRQMIESYIWSGLRGKAPSVSLDAIRERAATLARQGVTRADIEAARVAGEEAAKAAYNDELRRAVDSVLSIWGTNNARGSHQRVIRDFSNAADGVPVNPQGSDEERLQWALQVLRGGAEAYPFFSKRGFGGWQEATAPLTRIYAPAARIYPEWIPDYQVLDEGGVPSPGPVDYRRWVPLAEKLGFPGNPTEFVSDSDYGSIEILSPTFAAFVDRKRAEGFDFVAHRGNFHNYNNLFGFKLPNGEVVGQTRTGDDDDVVSFFRQFLIPAFSIAGGFAFLGGQIAGFTGIPANYASGFLRAAVATAGGQDVDRALLSALGPVVIQDILPPTVWQAPDLGTIDPGLIGGDELLPSLPEPVVELLTAPELPPVLPPPVPMQLTTEMQLPPLLPPPPLPEPVVELLPPPELPPELLTAPELPPELLPPVPMQLTTEMQLPPLLPPPPLPEPVVELLPPLDLPPALPAPTIDPIGAPTMDDFFTADDYAFPAEDGGFGFDFDTLDPIPTVDAGEWFVGPMPLPDFPAIEPEDVLIEPVYAGDAEDLFAVGNNLPELEIETPTAPGRGTSYKPRETAPATSSASVADVLKSANDVMLQALRLVDSYRKLTNPPAVNQRVRLTDRASGTTSIAMPDGTVEMVDRHGNVARVPIPPKKPTMTIDGSMVINNGDGTYTSISPSGSTATYRYQSTMGVSTAPGASASVPGASTAAPGGYSTALLIGGAILALAVFS